MFPIPASGTGDGGDVTRRESLEEARYLPFQMNLVTFYFSASLSHALGVVNPIQNIPPCPGFQPLNMTKL